jgi:hypothetical protein
VFEQSQARISEQLDDLNSAVKSLTLVSSPAIASNSQAQTSMALPVAQPNQRDTVAISMSEIGHSCPIWCGCICHARQNINLFSILFISYIATPFRPRKCSERSCKSGVTGFGARMTYYFPRFLLSKALAIHIGMNQYNEPAFSLAIRNVVPPNASIFAAAHDGDVEGLKLLLGSREFHPNDISELDGTTALHVSTSRRGLLQADQYKWQYALLIYRSLLCWGSNLKLRHF